MIDIPTMVNKRKDHAYFYNDPDYDIKIDDSKVFLVTSLSNLYLLMAS